MPTTHEVVYFDSTGRAEPIRILLSIAKVEYIDTRFKGADWPSIKPTTPLGFVPLLNIDGVQYCQSVGLARYAARLAGSWYPQDLVEALKVDETCESLNELPDLIPTKKDSEDFEKARKEFQEGKLTQYITLVEKRIQENGGLYVSGKTPTVADLFLESTVSLFESGLFDHIDKDFFDNFPGAKATVKAVAENEHVKAYREKATKKEGTKEG